ncbi:hypothetical protein NM688_g1212 [Phlebia brevispora]|uniref:Uncharacterized protein n=1 Tax=Phlebia brevispora TaxID=194682 RepID=A0ACC1TC64_9APHY|nr:hypothetical protein NM688_g1212 [Phlebia brevispora]
MSHGKQFTLYTTAYGPNGWKVEFVLQELGLTYEPLYLKLKEGEHKDPSHTKYNPNGRIPTIIDHHNNDFVIWESNAILFYLAEKYDTKRKISVDSFEEKMIEQQWLFFQASGQGAYFGQCGWFKIVGPPPRIPAAIERYQKEILRVFGVLDGVLAKQEWLVGGKCTIADISFVMWNEVAVTKFLNDYPGFDFERDFPALCRREFSNHGYIVALISSNEQNLQNLANELKSAGREAAYYAVSKYDYDEMHNAFEYFKRVYPNDEIRAALWNVTEAVRKPFLDLKKEDMQKMVDADVVAGFGFAQEAIKAFKQLEPNKYGKRGFLAFTSATGSRRGAPNCAISSTGKFALRALSQTVAKEFKTDDIHVSHVIVDALILTERWKVLYGDEWYAEKTKDEKHRTHPASIAKAYIYLAQQDTSAWTWELDLRPSHENWTW